MLAYVRCFASTCLKIIVATSLAFSNASASVKPDRKNRSTKNNSIKVIAFKGKKSGIYLTDGQSSIYGSRFRKNAFQLVKTETKSRGGMLKTSYVFQRFPSRYVMLAQTFKPFQNYHHTTTCSLSQSSIHLLRSILDTDSYKQLERLRINQVNPVTFASSIDDSCNDGEFRGTKRLIEDALQGIEQQLSDSSSGASSAKCVASKFDPITAYNLKMQVGLMLNSERPIIECRASESSFLALFNQSEDKIVLHKPPTRFSQRNRDNRSVDQNLAETEKTAWLMNVLTHELIHRAGASDETETIDTVNCCFLKENGACNNVKKYRENIHNSLDILSDDPKAMGLLSKLAEDGSTEIDAVTSELIADRNASAERLKKAGCVRTPGTTTALGENCTAVIEAEYRTTVENIYKHCSKLKVEKQASCEGDKAFSLGNFLVSDTVKGCSDPSKQFFTCGLPMEQLPANAESSPLPQAVDVLRGMVVTDRENAQSERDGTPVVDQGNYQPAPDQVNYESPRAASEYVETIAAERSSVLGAATDAARYAQNTIRQRGTTRSSGLANSGQFPRAPSALNPGIKRSPSATTSRTNTNVPTTNISIASSLTGAPKLLGFPVSVASAAVEQLVPVANANSGGRVEGNTSLATGKNRTVEREVTTTVTRSTSRSSTVSSGSSSSEPQMTGASGPRLAKKELSSSPYSEAQAIQDALTSYSAVKPTLENPVRRAILNEALRRPQVNTELIPLEGMSLGSTDPEYQLTYQRGRPDMPPKRQPVDGI